MELKSTMRIIEGFYEMQQAQKSVEASSMATLRAIAPTRWLSGTAAKSTSQTLPVPVDLKLLCREESHAHSKNNA